jgi:hypothetical protein
LNGLKFAGFSRQLKLVIKSTLKARYDNGAWPTQRSKRWAINPAGKPSEDGCRPEKAGTIFRFKLFTGSAGVPPAMSAERENHGNGMLF